MDSNLKTISKIFTERIYRIPDYQRGYAWRIKEVKDYWNDILQLDSGKNHYVGVITLETVKQNIYEKWDHDTWIIEGKSYEPFYVVDGQQRLTTTILLIQSICEVADQKKIKKLNFTDISEIRRKFIFESNNGISRSYLFGYEKDNPSYEFLKVKIFGENSPSGYVNEETIYTHNLQNSKTFFIEQLSELDVEDIESIFNKITQHLLFNIYAMQDDIDVFVAFESMNNRGLRLSNLELLKNRLIYLSTKLTISESDKDSLRTIVNDAWKSIYHYLGKNKDNPLIDDVFLYNHTLMYFGRTDDYVIRNIRGRQVRVLLHPDTTEELSQRLLEEVFSPKPSSTNRYCKPKPIKEYAENISKAVEIWFSLKNPLLSSTFNDEEKLWAERLDRLIFRSMGREFYPALLSFYLKNPTKKQSVSYLRELERYIFTASLLRSRTHVHRKNMTGIVDKLLKQKLTVDDSIKLVVDASNEMLTELPEALTENWKYISEFYEWSTIYYFLFEYEQSLREKAKASGQKIDWQIYISDLDDCVTIEHIYPQRATDRYWVNLFRQYSPQERRRLCDSLGNLLPLSKAKNSSLQNWSFTKKIDNGKSVGYRYGSYSENHISRLDDWTAEDILNRGLDMLEFMEHRWGIQIGDKKSKINFLRLQFLNKTSL